jgi:hypothetical protein
MVSSFVEHIIQASDVDHMMEHWNIFKMWNEWLFDEMCISFTTGQSEKEDPSIWWYKGHILLFDKYNILLAEE